MSLNSAQFKVLERNRSQASCALRVKATLLAPDRTWNRVGDPVVAVYQSAPTDGRDL